MSDQKCTATQPKIEIDVIIPVHNAAATIEDTVRSAMDQLIPSKLISSELQKYALHINVCCYDDGSTDESWTLLSKLHHDYENVSPHGQENVRKIPSRLLIAKSPDGFGRGAGYARNRAAELPSIRQQTQLDESRTMTEYSNIVEQFLCLLDSDDVMHKHRIAEQIHGMMMMPKDERAKTLMGCKVERDPPGSTWHYTRWANSLSDERLYLERFREVTLLQPTWMICRSRFDFLGGYIEAPKSERENVDKLYEANDSKQSTDQSETESNFDRNTSKRLQLIHPTFDTPQTLRLAEDLRFFHAHLYANGLLKLHRPCHDPDLALVTYRHRQNQSQSYQTPRKLLLHLRALAFERCVLENRKKSIDNIIPWKDHNGRFVVWGAGRDGKDFVKALSDGARKRIYCFVDVDTKKIQQGFYVNKELGLNIPIVHFSLLTKERVKIEASFGKIDKRETVEGQQPNQKKPRLGGDITTMTHQVAQVIDLDLLAKLPIVVCVAMYRTNGALERNTISIGRSEGNDLWHFS